MSEDLKLENTPYSAFIRTDIARVSESLIERARMSDAATLHEAGGRTGVLPSQIKPLDPKFKLAGAAITVHSPGGDNLWLHRALYIAQPGDVLVVYVNQAYDFGYWGEIMSTAARERQLGGLVIDGCVRDGSLLQSIGFPVFSRGLCIRGTGKDHEATGWINQPLILDDVIVEPGDLIVGDQDGLVCVPRTTAEDVVKKALVRQNSETEIIKRIDRGERTLEIYRF